MTERLVGALVFAFVVSVATAADTYRWEDEQGNVYYSDQLPPSGARNVQRTLQQAGAPEPVLPYRLQVVVKNFPVTLYVSDCGQPCERARELLLQRGVPHTLMDVSNGEVQEALMGLTGGELEVPVVKIGKNVLRGFEDGQWNTALDAAGYPSYAMIDVKPVIPQQAGKSAGRGSTSGEADATGDADTDSSDTVAGGAEQDELASDSGSTPEFEDQ